jgi:tellurite resistance protein
MSNMTRDDLKTILQFGIHIAKIDNDFAVWEKKLLARFAEAMKLTEAEKQEMVDRQVSLSRGLQSLSSQDARALLLKTLCAVSHSDGEEHPAEMEFIQKVIEKLGGQIFILAKAEWGSYEQEVLQALSESS